MSALRRLLADRAAAAPRRTFVGDARSSRSVDYATLYAATQAWHRELDALGIAAGRRVLLDVADPMAFTVAHIGILAAGRCSCPVDPAAPPAETARTRRTLRPVLVVTDKDSPLGLRVDPDSGWPAGSDARETGFRSDAAPGSAALCTSGSTGAPKTVVLEEHQLLHVARAVARHHRLCAADRGYNPLPLFHINAQVVGLLATLAAGGTLVLDRRFSRTGFWELLVDQEITWVNAVPAILTILARSDVTSDVTVVPSALRFIRSASAPLPVAVRELVSARTGVPVVESYGMTEAASQITATPLDGPYRPGSVGLPVGVELVVVDQDGQPCPPGVIGHVRIRGAGVIRSYADGAAADRFDQAGWLDTGDLGSRDLDGHLYLAGRADDVVNRGGELVHPREVEEVLLGEPAVAEAVVVGRPDEVLGAVPVACVRPGRPLTDVESAALVDLLAGRCATHLSRFKRPAEIHVVTAFPVGPTGKVRRRRLRDLVVELVDPPTPIAR